MADDTLTVQRTGDIPAARQKLLTPPQQQLNIQPAQPAATGTATAPAAAPATGAQAAPAAQRALPSPTLTANAAGEVMTNADMANRASLGNTPDVAAAARQRLASAPAPAAAAPASSLAGATTSPGVGAAPPATAAAPNAPNWQTAPGAAGPEAINPDASRAARVSPARAPNWTVGEQPAAAPAAAAGEAAAGGQGAARTVLSRLAPLATGAAKVARGVGYGAAGLEGINAVNQAAAGNYGAAGISGGLGALDAAASYAPSLPTIGAAATAHAADYLASTEPAQQAFRTVANALPNSGLDQTLGAIRDTRQNIESRDARGLPVSQNMRDRYEGMTTRAALDFNLPDSPVFVDPSNPYTRNLNPPTRDVQQPGAGSAAANFSNVQSGAQTARPGDAPPVPRGAAATLASGWSQNARDAMNSSAPGTAVINGQVYSPEQIQALANRNVISSDAFRNPGLGVAYSEATGGGTPELGAGAKPRQQGFTAADRERQLANIESGPDSRADAAAQSRQNARDSLVSDVRSALRSGKRKTAGRLIELLTATNGAEASDARLAAANRPQRQPAGRTDAQEALTAAQMEEAQANTATARQKLATENRVGQLQDALVSAKTPEERQQIGSAIALLSGKELPQQRQQIVRVPAPGVDPSLGITAPAVFDPATGSVSWPKGLSGVYTDAQGNTQRQPLAQ